VAVLSCSSSSSSSSSISRLRSLASCKQSVQGWHEPFTVT
jgi:hypothetical protein